MSAKIRLSEEEIQLVGNSEWILTKNRILEKIKGLLLEVLSKQQDLLQKNPGLLPASLLQTSPKISRGENYRGLPWLVLDYPRHFSKPDVFAIRTLFWWGQFFSVTLHLSGAYKQQMIDTLVERADLFAAAGCFYCINEDEWEHHLQPDNYVPLSDTEPQQRATLLRSKRFLKLCLVIPLNDWEKVQQQLFAAFELFVSSKQ